MKDKLIIIAAGSSSRWDNYTGTTKHLVEINDFTDDFDRPENYRIWLKHYNNRKQ